MPRRKLLQTLRGRLVLACLGVQAVVGLGLLAMGSQQLLTHFSTQRVTMAQQLVTTLEHAIATPLAQRDYATLQQLLSELASASEIRYLVLSDHRHVRIAAAGWPADRPLPPPDSARVDLHRADGMWHTSVKVGLAGQHLGQLSLGVSTLAQREAHEQFVWRGALGGALAMLISALAIGAISLRMTKRLSGLSAASERVAAGDHPAPLPTLPDDELGRLGASFNRMASTIEHRMQALQASEASQRAQVQLVDEERRRLNALLGALGHGVVLVTEDQIVAYANQAFAQLWRLAEDPSGKPVPRLVRQMSDLVVGDQADTVLGWAQPGSSTHGRPELRLRDGRLVVHRRHAVPSGGSIWVHEDVTAERLIQQRAEQALVDPLTRLANRRGLYESLQSSLAATSSHGPSLALLFIDLDDFKRANDLGGHRAGDQLLTAVGAALASELQAGQLVARLGGDEFAVVAPQLEPPAAQALAARLVAAVDRVEVASGPWRLRVGCSVGVALSPQHAVSADELMACADTAMYQAKHAGKGQWAFFSAEAASVRAQSARMDWNERIRRALDSGRFVLHLQPVLRCSDHQLMHHEALIRMVDEHDPERLIKPSEFIPQAERSGRIVQIDWWVLSQCIRFLSLTPATVCVAANLSVRTLEAPELLSHLEGELRRHGVDARRLHIELTETVDLHDEPLAIRRMAELKALGCQLHLDDFGAGFNTLARLQQMTVDAVKIDGSFVRDLEHDPVHRLLVAALVQVARSLHKQTIAEHVETPAVWAILQDLGVDMVQGQAVGEPKLMADCLASISLSKGAARLASDPIAG